MSRFLRPDEKFEIGDIVEKVGGRYGGPGRVAVTWGDHVSVEHMIQDGWGVFFHIYHPSQLKLVSRKGDTDEAGRGS